MVSFLKKSTLLTNGSVVPRASDKLNRSVNSSISSGRTLALIIVVLLVPASNEAEIVEGGSSL